MSATGRGERLGGPDDFYATPAYCVRRLLEEIILPGGRWVEPGAGSGAVIRAVNGCREDVTWTAIEKRPEEQLGLEPMVCGGHVLIGDYLTQAFVGADVVKVVIGNPPYNAAIDFITRSLALFPQAHVVFLLRLNFAASRKRAALMRRCPPDVYVLPNRPSFRNGKTDATEYAWFVWPPGNRTAGTFRVLATTPAHERKAAA